MVKKKFGEKLGKGQFTFSERVVQIALSIPKGKVTTYGHIARAAGGANMASRCITGILSKAYDRGVKNIPFHRIVYAGGRIWIDERHREERLKKYKTERIQIDPKGKVEGFQDQLYLAEF